MDSDLLHGFYLDNVFVEPLKGLVTRTGAALMALTLRIWAGAIIVAILCVEAVPAQSSTVIFLVRHAEKSAEATDPSLSEAGEKRAQALASSLRDAGVQLIYSTDYRRTRDTAAPLAAQLGLEVTIYDPEKLADLAADIKQRGGRCLVVGHSNTTPELVDLLGGDPGAPIDEQSEYDRLYVVTIGPDGAVETVLLRY